PLQASVLYFSRTTHQLEAYDEITLGGLGLTSVSVERHVIGKPKPLTQPEAPASSAPASSAPASTGPANSGLASSAPATSASPAP
ncbi:MAG: hypothetical protein QOJ62_543, partial [Actinomycetota bacterium]|nr:hypothetical protein [Actinomycetota bacterium]